MIARDSHSAVKIENKMYIFGGSIGDNTFNDIYSFDLDKESNFKFFYFSLAVSRAQKS
jgi:hypothetical protein